jgi:hypothetical protein
VWLSGSPWLYLQENRPQHTKDLLPLSFLSFALFLLAVLELVHIRTRLTIILFLVSKERQYSSQDLAYITS